MKSLDNNALEQLFLNARTHNGWQDKPVSEELLKQLYDLIKFAPTAVNGLPARFLFVTSKEAKEKLKSCLMEGNIEKTMQAPVTVIIGYDLTFYEHLPLLFNHNADAKSWFEGNDALIEETAFRNSSLQGGYLIMAARALGLDCGAMSGFDKEKLNAEFFPEGKIKANFLCNLGYGDPMKLYPRSPRLNFEQACQIL
jgi:3-hydroxypropanoate dehydrogenase